MQFFWVWFMPSSGRINGLIELDKCTGIWKCCSCIANDRFFFRTPRKAQLIYLSQLIFQQKYSNRYKKWAETKKKWKKFASLKCLLLTFTDIKIHYELWATDRICLFKISSTLVVLLMNWNALLRNKRDKNRVKADTKEMETRKKTVKWHTNEKLCVCAKGGYFEWATK